MDNKTKFQPISKRFLYEDLHKLDLEQNNGTAKGYCDVEFSIDENIDKRYRECVGISIKTTGDFTTNVNGEVSQPILIDDKEIFPVGFDTGLAFPMEQNREFTNFKHPIALNNSKVEGRVKFHFSGFPTVAVDQYPDPKKVIYCAQVVLHLENSDGKQNVDMAAIVKRLDEMSAKFDKVLNILTAKK